MKNQVWVLNVVKNGGDIRKPMVFLSAREARDNFAIQCRQYGFKCPVEIGAEGNNIAISKDGTIISLQQCGVVGIEESRMDLLFCNLGSEDAPENPKQFLRDFGDSFWDDEDPRHPGKYLDVFSLFEGFSAEDLLDYIESGELR